MATNAYCTMSRLARRCTRRSDVYVMCDRDEVAFRRGQRQKRRQAYSRIRLPKDPYRRGAHLQKVNVYASGQGVGPGKCRLVGC